MTAVTLMTSSDTSTTPTYCLINGFMPDNVISNDKSIMMWTVNGQHSDGQTEKVVNMTIDCVAITICMKVLCCLLLIGY